ncbi:fibronectin type III domain-containing protein [Aquisalimonas sp. 2447]|uniref:fibronectin type III domain-containing protein n=1 Tax=Aquisalimonas sp. 2447 TaxID=2740807 RepID=UPI0014326695|nr:fibronectin type III domain-containing protein [Aquisalimonas sp. 2447]QIT56350.1 fibronectin type III domain-containing protein [Aquisalimonas sp. 2447]
MLVDILSSRSSRTRSGLAAVGVSLSLILGGCIDNGGGFDNPGNGDSAHSYGGASGSGDGEVTLSWERPTSREDGTTFMASEVDHYEIAYGSSSDDYTETFETANTSARINSLPTGESYYFTVRVRDTSGLISEFAPEISATVD